VTRVLLTDGDQRSTLAATRALGRAGLAVYVGDESSDSLASRSRYCAGAVRYPSPFDCEDEFVGTIAAEAARLGVDLVMPMADITSAVLAERRSALGPRVRVAVPDAETFWRASDKGQLDRLARRLDVPTPTTHCIARPDDLDRLADVAFPCVIKPARSRLRTPAGWVRTSVMRASSRDELESLVSARPELKYPFLVQRVIAGEGVGVFALCDHGMPRLLFGHRRLREKPPSGGVSVLREAVPLDPVATAYACQLLEALQWHGVAMVEFKRERSSGTPYLMEINARFWGSLQLAIDAGVNFPLHAVRLWMGEPLPYQAPYVTGIRSRWLLGDLDHLLQRLSARRDLPSDAPPLWRFLLDFVRFFRRNTRYEVESWNDPAPSLYEVRSYARDIIRSLSRSGR
jgi:predicted ATP-grasp superfamily ATP-dependent carboligase